MPGGHRYTVSRYRDPAGCLIGERWIIHGMPHAWPGGTTDPKYAGYTDTRAPDGAEGTWGFLERYRMSETGTPCAEAKRCPARSVRVKLARRPRVRRVSATAAGDPMSARIRGHGRRVKLRLPPGPRGTVTVVLRVRRQGGAPAQVLRRAFERC